MNTKWESNLKCKSQAAALLGISKNALQCVCWVPVASGNCYYLLTRRNLGSNPAPQASSQAKLGLHSHSCTSIKTNSISEHHSHAQDGSSGLAEACGLSAASPISSTSTTHLSIRKDLKNLCTPLCKQPWASAACIQGAALQQPRFLHYLSDNTCFQLPPSAVF